MSADVVILVPVLHRVHRIEPLLDSIDAATKVNHRVLFIASPEDTRMHDAVRAYTDDLLIIDVPVRDGDYARKINAGVRATTEPYILLGADDLHFHNGWFEAAVALMTDKIHVVGTNDLGSQRVMVGDHSTHTLVTRDYAKRGTFDDPTQLLCERYPHEYVDDELVGVAKKRKAWAFAFDSIVEHLHPNWKHPDGSRKAPMDSLYAQSEERMERGRQLFRRRSRHWQ